MGKTPPPDDRFLNIALEEARLGLSEGGIPIGAAIAKWDGTDWVLAGGGHNRRVQDGDPTCHGETDAARKAGRHDFTQCVLYTTLSPCAYCAELVLLLRIPRVVIGECRTFPGVPERMRAAGVEVIVKDDQRCVALMEDFIGSRPDLWNEDIGVESGGSASYRRAG